MTESNTIRYFHDDQEYVTRAQIISYFNIPPSNLDRLLAQQNFTKVEDCAKFYYKKDEVWNCLQFKVEQVRNEYLTPVVACF